MPTLSDRVALLLLSRRGKPICAACAAGVLGLSHKSAHEAMMKLESRSGFRRRYGRCSVCGKTRIVTEAASWATVSTEGRIATVGKAIEDADDAGSASLIIVLILERPLCATCISAKSGLTAAEVDAYFARIGRSLAVRRATDDRCRVCGDVGVVFSIHREAE